MEKGFYEGGIFLNNIIISGTTGVGISVYYRYGTYADPDWKKNIVPKFTVSLKL
jgi:hypothetical protein